MGANAELQEIIRRFNEADARFDSVVREFRKDIALRGLESAFTRAAKDGAARIPSYLSAAILHACAAK